MGTRLGAYLLDLDAFEYVLNLPAWRILSLLRQKPAGEDIAFNVYDHANKARYVRAADQQIKKIQAGRSAVISDDQLASVSELQQTVRHYIVSEPSYFLYFLLRDVPAVQDVPYAHEITVDQKMFWVGSLLTSAKEIWHSTDAFNELETYLARLLRGKYSGYPTKKSKWTLKDANFALLPAGDSDLQIAVFQESECLRLVELFENLIDSRPEFGPPLLWERKNDGIDWDEWVREMIGNFLKIIEIDAKRYRLVTFIG